MALFPRWLKEFPGEFWRTITGQDEPVAIGEYKTGISNWISNIGTGIKDTVEPVLEGARKALTPSVLWILIVALLALWIIGGFKKILRG